MTITKGCFIVSGRVSNAKDQLLRSDIGLDKYFFKYLSILVAAILGPAVLYVFSKLRMSSASSFVMGDKKKEFSFKFCKYELKDFGGFGIL